MKILVYTASSGVLDLADPQQLKLLTIHDLIKGLSRRDRYGAQIGWTVLQHSLVVAELSEQLERPTALTKRRALLHDLSEGLLGDMQQPIRVQMPFDCVWETAHRLINRELAERYDLAVMGSLDFGWDEVPSVKLLDYLVFHAEVETFVPHGHRAGFQRRELTKGEQKLVQCAMRLIKALRDRPVWWLVDDFHGALESLLPDTEDDYDYDTEEEAEEDNYP